MADFEPRWDYSQPRRQNILLLRWVDRIAYYIRRRQTPPSTQQKVRFSFFGCVVLYHLGPVIFLCGELDGSSEVTIVWERSFCGAPFAEIAERAVQTTSSCKNTGLHPLKSTHLRTRDTHIEVGAMTHVRPRTHAHSQVTTLVCQSMCPQHMEPKNPHQQCSSHENGQFLKMDFDQGGFRPYAKPVFSSLCHLFVKTGLQTSSLGHSP